jgi:large subunit ribosomal protein L10
MALSKEKKAEVVSEVAALLSGSKLTVIAEYSGTSVQSLQQLRRSSSDSGTVVRVIKNRLFKKVLETSPKFKDLDLNFLNGQLIYAFNSEDEVAPAQNLAAIAKQEPQIQFMGGINQGGQFLAAEDVMALAALPGKDQLRAQLVGTIGAPLSGFVNVMAGNVRAVLSVLNARSDQLS